MIELLILSILDRGSLHGYELRRQIRKEMGFLTAASFGSIYPAISRLKRAGAVIEVALHPNQVKDLPAPGSLTGERALLKGAKLEFLPRPGLRLRRVYQITPVGRKLLREMLASPIDTDPGRSFGIRLALASHLSEQERAELIKERLSELADQRRELKQGENLGDEFVGLARRRAAVLAEAEERFLKEVLAGLQEGRLARRGASAQPKGERELLGAQ